MILFTGFRGAAIRSVCWRIFLGVLPHDDTTVEHWIRILTLHRNHYNQLCETFLVDPHKQDDVGDLLVNNPLAQVDSFRPTFPIDSKRSGVENQA